MDLVTGLILTALTEPKREPRTRFYDSDAGKCLRQRVLKRLNATEAPIPVEDTLPLAFGRWTHAAVGSLLTRVGAIPVLDGEPQTEIKLKDTHTSGQLDYYIDTSLVKEPYRAQCQSLLGWSEWPNLRVLMDLKTISGWAFKHLTAPKPEHILQLGRYLIKFPHPVDVAYLVYLEKSGGDTKGGWSRSFRLDPSDMTWLAAVKADQAAEITAWEEYHADGTLPPMLAPHTDRSWQCVYCPMFASCPGMDTISKYSPTQDPTAASDFKKVPKEVL